MRKKLASAAASGFLLIVACSVAPVQKREPKELILSLQSLERFEVGETLSFRYREDPEVESVSFNRDRAEVRLLHFYQDSKVLVSQAIALGYKVVEGAGRGSYLPSVLFPPQADTSWASANGAEFELTQKIAKGKVTVITFGAKWCGKCREFESFLSSFQEDHKVAVRRVDIGDWASPVVQQYEIDELPTYLLFSDKGVQTGRYSGGERSKFEAALKETGSIAAR